MGKLKIYKKKYQLKLTSDTANLEIIRDFVSGIARNIGFNAEDINRIELAVDEASTNVIRHAYKGKNENRKLILINVSTYRDRIEINVIDKGKGFNPKKIKSPDMDTYLKKMKRGGLGVFLIKTLMDKVDYHINPGVHNRVKMIKYFQ
jgi:serine/threonine-protein kinase RsbW